MEVPESKETFGPRCIAQCQEEGPRVAVLMVASPLARHGELSGAIPPNEGAGARGLRLGGPMMVKDPEKQCIWQEYTQGFVHLGMPIYREPVT